MWFRRVSFLPKSETRQKMPSGLQSPVCLLWILIQHCLMDRHMADLHTEVQTCPSTHFFLSTVLYLPGKRHHLSEPGDSLEVFIFCADEIRLLMNSVMKRSFRCRSMETIIVAFWLLAFWLLAVLQECCGSSACHCHWATNVQKNALCRGITTFRSFATCSVHLWAPSIMNELTAKRCASCQAFLHFLRCPWAGAPQCWPQCSAW